MTDHQPPKRSEKKSEMLDVRLPYGLKQALVKACRKQGVTVSDTVRGLIREYVQASAATSNQTKLKDIAMKLVRNPRKTLGMTAVTALCVLLFTAQPSIADDALFGHFDQDANGILDTEELGHEIIVILDRDHSGTIEMNEFERQTSVNGTTDMIFETANGTSVRELSYTIRDLTFPDMPGESSLNVYSCSDQLDQDASEAEAATLLAKLTETCTRNRDTH